MSNPFIKVGPPGCRRFVGQPVVKCLLIAGAFALAIGKQALAADISSTAPATHYTSPVPIYNWSGIYVGLNGGLGWNQGTWFDTATGLPYGGTNTTGLLGVQVGGNYQINSFVVGLEGDFDGTLNNSTTTTTFVPGLTTGPGQIQESANNRWVTLLDVRFGYALDRVLFYAKGGGAWVMSNGSTFTNTTVGGSFTSGGNGSNFGWTIGLGIEWACWANVSVKIEYDYIGLSSQQFTLLTPTAGFPAGDTFTNSDRSLQMLLVGLNYKFGW
jgi:outer membrane immunogenic protein